MTLKIIQISNQLMSFSDFLFLFFEPWFKIFGFKHNIFYYVLINVNTSFLFKGLCHPASCIYVVKYSMVPSNSCIIAMFCFAFVVISLCHVYYIL